MTTTKKRKKLDALVCQWMTEPSKHEAVIEMTSVILDKVLPVTIGRHC